MNAKILAYFEEHKVKLNTSLDGPEELHLKNRPMQKKYYNNFIKWIESIKKENKVTLSALLTTTRFSFPYPKQIVDTYIKLGFKTVWFRTLNNIGAALEAWEKIGYSSEEFFEFWKTGVEYAYKNGIKEYSSYLLLKKILQRQDPNFVDLMSPCGAAIGQMAYDYNGDIFTCDEVRMINEEHLKLGNVLQNSYDEVMVQPKVRNIVRISTNDKPPCTACPYQPYCGICPVYNCVNSGSLLPSQNPDFRCRILKCNLSIYLKE